MAKVLYAVNSAAFGFDNNTGTSVPYQRGTVLPELNVENETLRLFATYDINRSILKHTSYEDLINGSTGVAFASFAELITFCEDNILKGESGGAGSNMVLAYTYFIKDVPVGPNDKLSGENIQDNNLIGVDINKIIEVKVDNDSYTDIQPDDTGEINFDTVTGTISQADGSLYVDGEKVTIWISL